MKYIAFTAISLFLFGCEQPNVTVKPTQHRIPRGKTTSESMDLKVVEIEGCEYFMCINYEGNVLAHKGNCKNPIHPENQKQKK